MHTLSSPIELRQVLASARREGRRIALVPTMGNLHQGHLTLIAEARASADLVVATIFVNPLQFGAGEDLDAYPRTLADDQAGLEASGCDLLFTPNTAAIYPQGLEHHARVRVPIVSEGLCGGSRPGHFDGVATVVAMLFNLVQPNIAYFGEKDYQQLAVIRQLVADLHYPIEIIGVPTVRAEDGLALSSRNGYLNEEERRRAPGLYRTLCELRDELLEGRALSAALDEALRRLSERGFAPDYLEVRAADLGPVQAQTRQLIILAAARLGPTRLIDNLALTLP
ncbi:MULTISPECIES: pantoate--beta-alanine ligase [Halomonadaceae]|uniref:pantoate--beta-alanine ligase n=1 Tax=Halomonadaceae TaxID=28256 RepID=UPI001597D600|nr:MULTISPECIES: pantoate--beta-alanine ligase [Halomonas]QJQ96506.1 pantoate--beta-alanine ligase [Halomonas sp. PA5]